MIVAIDGPAGSGKTTVAKLLAQKLGIFYLDTGATYRCLTYSALENNLDLSNEEFLLDLSKSLDIKMTDTKVYLGGVDVSQKIRTPRIDKNISVIVAYSKVREVMVDLQRRIAAIGDFVVEGRDITTVVFPESKYKFYLDADPKIRAQRRFKELKTKGIDVDSAEVRQDLEKRDYADKNRDSGPLRISKDAECVDTTGLSIAGVVDVLYENIKLKSKEIK